MKKKESKTVIGYKAFNKGLKCRDFQYKIGETFTTDKTIKICNTGFHFCENPLDTLGYYDLVDSECNVTEFAIVETDGTVQTEGNKSVTDKITIKSALNLPGFIKASFDFMWQKCSENDAKNIDSGHSSQLATSGHSSRLATSGHYSRLATSGDYSQLAIKGKNSIGAAVGRHSTIKGIKGTWIVLAEYNNKYEVICVKSAQIDGKTLKANIAYKLENGEFVEA